MAIIMEGPLSKWTNVMKGWQYRWFVLNENAGLLSYYTSKEKMVRGSRRGCVRLKGAVIGIDDEDDSTFTLTVDQKTFHFQARDAEEKEKWIDALETTILRHSQSSKKEGKSAPSMGDFEKKLAEADAYLQILIDQVKDVEVKLEQCEDEASKERYIAIKNTAEAMIESIKQSIVLLQITKAEIKANSQTIQSAVDAVSVDSISLEPATSPPTLTASSPAISTTASAPDDRPMRVELRGDGSARLAVGHSDGVAKAEAPGCHGTAPAPIPTSNLSVPLVPALSYSSSEDECFYDAEDGHQQRVNGVRGGSGNSRGSRAARGSADQTEHSEPKTPPPLIASKNDIYDELYDDQDEDELESLDKHGSIITHLLSQVRIGMDLTKIVLPTFILEKRSLLEMFADFLAHPDLFSSIGDERTPRDRLVHCTRWYLSAFHAGRRSSVAKKPYNPILGETFQCHYDMPHEASSAEKATDGPVPWASKNNIAIIAEQVSHHPPISAFYAENQSKRICIDGYIWTKSKFLGLSIGVHMIGQAIVTVLDHDEDYSITFPNAYGRSILTVPWVELGGKMTINCAKTGYYSNIEFHTKPFYGGKKDQITAELFAPSEKKPFCVVKGEWNGAMWAKWATGESEKFLDTKAMPIMKKLVKPIDQQVEFESRRLWQEVTKSLKAKDVTAATAAKHALEQRQREEAKQRKEAGTKWQTKHFHEVGEHWVYDNSLVRRSKHSH